MDSSTTFVRSCSVQYSIYEGPGSSSNTDSSPDTKKTVNHTRLVESAAHAALPLVDISSQFWADNDSVCFATDIVMPPLNPPIMRIDRPPIS